MNRVHPFIKCRYVENPYPSTTIAEADWLTGAEVDDLPTVPSQGPKLQEEHYDA